MKSVVEESQDRWLALMETSGNQAFIFETNRLGEAVGGSFLVAESARKAAALADTLQGRRVLNASGLAACLFQRQDQARSWLTQLGLWAADEAPGLDLAGVVVPKPADQDISTAIDVAWSALAAHRGTRAGPQHRFQTLPWLRPGDYAGLPAVDLPNKVRPEHDRGRLAAAATHGRRQAARSGREALKKTLAENHGFTRPLAWQAAELDDLSEPDWNWRAVVHADGNGLGRIFLNLGGIARELGHRGDADYLQFSRQFSQAVNEATWRAMAHTLRRLGEVIPGDTPLPIYPLLLGGDDLTFVCDGRYALLLASTYLEAFEKQSAGLEPIRQVRQAVTRVLPDLADADFEGLRACAGVAIVKHHFPFSVAYQLAEALCGNAKQSIREHGGSALDFHAVLDASPPDLDSIRRALVDPAGNPLTRRPYGVGDPPSGSPLPLFQDLIAARDILLKQDPDNHDRLLPNGPMHRLRQALFLGEAHERRTLSVLRAGLPGAAPTKAMTELLEKLGSTDGSLRDERSRSGFIDVLDHQRFMEGCHRS